MGSTPVDLDSLSLTDLIQIQNAIPEVLRRRFQTSLALLFTDVVGSTPYFAQFGDDAGHGLQQRHFDFLRQVLLANGGRIVDTAGDGAFSCFPSVESAVQAMIEFQNLIWRKNTVRTLVHQISVRCGIHWGPVLSDGTVVTGDAVNICSRVAATAAGGEIRVTREAFQQLSIDNRVRCKELGPMELKGVSEPVVMMVMEWRDTSRFPEKVCIEETGQEIVLPLRNTISFGRLGVHEGVPANDIVLALKEPELTLQISRWHFELRRQPDGFVLRLISDKKTEVNGQELPKGSEVPIGPGDVVRLSDVVTLRFERAVPQAIGTTTSMPPVHK